MKFINFRPEKIKEMSQKVGDYYEFCFGSPVDVTGLSSQNNFLSENLAKVNRSDGLMVQYTPTNKVYFSEEALSDRSDALAVGIKDGVAVVDPAFGYMSGLLAFTQWNGREIRIAARPRYVSAVRDRVHLLGVGLKNGELFGLYCLPAYRGIYLSDREGFGYSSTTYEHVDLKENIKTFGVEYLFEKSKVRG